MTGADEKIDVKELKRRIDELQAHSNQLRKQLDATNAEVQALRAAIANQNLLNHDFENCSQEKITPASMRKSR